MIHRSIFLPVASAVLVLGSFGSFQAQEKPPASEPEAASGRAREIEKLISDLGDKSFAVREDATRRLERLGKEAVPALEKAKGSSESETRDRAEYILARILGEGKARREAPSPEDEVGAVETQKMERELQEMKEQVDRILRELEGEEPMPRSFRRFRLPDEEFEGIGPGLPPRGLVPGPRGRSFEEFRGQGLGIRVRNVDPTLAAQLKLEKGQGVVAEEVLESTPARAAGLEPHDIILSLDGKAISGPNAVQILIQAVAGATRGKPLGLEILRGGEKLRLEVTLKERERERAERKT